MTAMTRPFRRLRGRQGSHRSTRPPSHRLLPRRSSPVSRSTSRESDPLFAYLQSAPGPGGPARSSSSRRRRSQQLREAGVALVVPLVTQGELIGTLNLGPRLSEQDYSSDDRRLLATLAAQAAPAIRVAQLVREQAAEAAERERYAAGAQGRAAHPAAVPAARAAEPARVADRGLLRPGACGRRRLLRLHRPRRGPHRRRRRRRDRQGRPGGAGHGPNPLDPAGRGAAPGRARQGPRPRQRARSCRRCRRRCSSPACTASSSPRPAASCSPTPATTCPTCARRMASSSSGPRACRSASCPGIEYEETEGDDRAGRRDAALLGRHRGAARAGRARCTASRACGTTWRHRIRRERAPRPAARSAACIHRPRLGAGGRHHDGRPSTFRRRSTAAHGPRTRPRGRADPRPTDPEVRPPSPVDVHVEGAFGNERVAMERVAEIVAPWA